MSTLDLKAQLSSLVKLQTIDSEIYALQDEKARKPEEIKALESDFEQKKERVAALEKQTLDLHKQRKEGELELAVKEQEAKKLQTQLYTLKTNKEYQVMLQQIDSMKADTSVIEDKIIALLDESDKAKIEIERQKQKLAEEEKIFQGKKKDIEGRLKQIDERLAQLDAQRRQAVPEVDANIFLQYERILRNRDGLGIVEARDNSCQGCNMFVPPQVINLIKMYERIITCEVCNRILYIQDETA